MNFDSFLQRVWYGRSRSRLSFYLLPFSWIFRAIVELRRLAYQAGLFRSVWVGRPVIVVGNITVGGTGKTPVVLWLVDQLRAAGYTPGIISRGYHGRSAHWPLDVTADSKAEEAGDEPVMLAQRCGCIVVAGPDRVAAARLAIERGADVIVSDDGMQHYRLGRDCELAVVDAERGLGNGRLLPAGPLRETADRLRQVDAVLLKSQSLEPSRSGLGLFKPREIPEGPTPRIPFLIQATSVRSLVTHEQRSLADFKGQPVHAIAGIGNPEAFFANLRSAGIIVLAHPLPDHARIGPKDLDFGDNAPVLMTEKDAVKCRDLNDPRVWAVVADAEIAPGQAALLMSIVKTALTSVSTAR